MIPAFWDASAPVPFCVRQETTPAVQRLIKEYRIVVWWAASVEMRSAFERLVRMGKVTGAEYVEAGTRLERLRLSWREVQPSDTLRSQAERFLTTYSLKAADALQLSAAWRWTSGAPAGRVFIAGDGQLLQAARQIGFQVVSA